MTFLYTTAFPLPTADTGSYIICLLHNLLRDAITPALILSGPAAIFAHEYLGITAMWHAFLALTCLNLLYTALVLPESIVWSIDTQKYM